MISCRYLPVAILYRCYYYALPIEESSLQRSAVVKATCDSLIEFRSKPQRQAIIWAVVERKNGTQKINDPIQNLDHHSSPPPLLLNANAIAW